MTEKTIFALFKSQFLVFVVSPSKKHLKRFILYDVTVLMLHIYFSSSGLYRLQKEEQMILSHMIT